jgi:DNA-binding transcriptional LysR family regulator
VPFIHFINEAKEIMRNLVSLRQLEALVKIVECGGLKEASDQLHVSPSAISKGLANLETMLGTTLLKRTTRSFALTDAGRYFYGRAVKLLQDLDESIDAATSFYDHPQGELRITCSIAFGYAHLISFINAYRKNYPEVDVYLDLSDGFVNLNEADFDIALRITSCPPVNQAMRKLSTINWAYCASPAYIEQHGRPEHISDLANHHILSYPGLTPDISFTDDNGLMVHPKIRTPIQANSSLILMEAAVQNQGIAYLPTYLLGKHIAIGDILPITLDGTVTYATHGLYALYFPSRYSNPKVRTFIDFMMAELQPIPGWDLWFT